MPYARTRTSGANSFAARRYRLAADRPLWDKGTRGLRFVRTSGTPCLFGYLGINLGPLLRTGPRLEFGVASDADEVAGE